MSTKLEQEIEEILARTGGPPPPTRLRRPSRTKKRLAQIREDVSTRLRSINAGQLMLASILIIIGSWFVLRSYDNLMLVVAVFGFSLFAFAFLLSIWRRRFGGPSTGEAEGQRYWRGQPIDYDSRRDEGFRNPFRRR